MKIFEQWIILENGEWGSKLELQTKGIKKGMSIKNETLETTLCHLVSLFSYFLGSQKV